MRHGEANGWWRRLTSAAVMAVVLAAGCRDSAGPGAGSTAPAPFVVASLGAPAPENSYVSLAPGTIPGGVAARVRVERTGATVTVQLVDGGFDPVAIRAEVDDTVTVDVRAGASLHTYRLVVPKPSRPTIVRTSPPVNKRDVPLNALIIVVFSEPMDPKTLTSGTIQLRRDGRAVRATLLGDPAHLTAQLVPDGPLAAGADYELVVTDDVRDLDGASLEATVVVPFGTDATPISTRLVFDSITAGRDHVCALTPEGVAYCWGDNAYGQLGNGTRAVTGRPTRVWAMSRFRSITAGEYHTCALATDGAAFCWGGNQHGALGTGASAGPQRCELPQAAVACSRLPVRVAGGVRFAQLRAHTGSAFFSSTCGVSLQGAAWCWGGNFWGADSGVRRSDRPVQVARGLVLRAIAPGLVHSCGLTPAGEAWCWGTNFWGQLGDGTNHNNRVTPAPAAVGLTFASLDANAYAATCGITTAGGAFCWGMLGVETTRAAPWCEDASDPDYGVFACSAEALPLSDDRTFKGMSLGILSPAGCVLTTAGAAHCWSGPQRDGVDPLVAVPGAPAFASIAVGQEGFACAVTPAGVAWCWGNNDSGVLGIGDDRAVSYVHETPVKVAGQP